MTNGKYIVIEGAEGVGKTTQLQELSRRLQTAGLPVRTFREPDSQSALTARAIRRLTQDPHYPMNSRTEVLLYNAARSESLRVIRQSVNNGIICLSDRNYLTTLALQYYGRGDIPDYQTINTIISFALNGIEPDVCIVLDAPADVLKQRTAGRYQAERFDNLSEDFLERVRAGYLWEAKQRNYPIIFATDSESEVADKVWKLVTKTLAVRESRTMPAKSAPPSSIKQVINDKGNATDAKLPQAAQTDVEAYQESKKPQRPPNYLESDSDGRHVLTDQGRQYLADAVTSVDENVYAFTEKISPVTIAAAMARLSRRGDDMRITILDEFAGKADKDRQLLHRVITAFGDDSVQQLVGLHVVVENASNLLTKHLEWGRLSAYLEQSTRYIYFDKKDISGRYRYYTPDTLTGNYRDQYKKAMDSIFELYSTMAKSLSDYLIANSSAPKDERDGAWRSAIRAQACDAIRSVLPVATSSTVGIFGSGQALENMIMHLLSNELSEARQTGEQLLKACRKVAPTFFERADKPERGGANVAYQANTSAAMAKLAKTYLPEHYASSEELESVTLIDFWPKNELLLVPDMLFEHSSMSLDRLQREVNAWPYEKKHEVFKHYVGERLNRRHKPGRAIEKAHYSFDLVCDYGIFRDLQRHRLVDDLNFQQLTPRYGYEIPKLVEDAGLTEQFEACFDVSLKLHSVLQQANYPLEAQYSTLLGHKMRWKVTYNAREAFHLHELRTSPQGHPGYRKLVMQMHEKVAEVHPLLAEAMRFVNTDEDPELTRLAAERYSQYKLSLLDPKPKN